MYSKVQFVFFSIILIITSCVKIAEQPFHDGTWFDLSHPYDSDTPYWPTGDGFKMDTVFEGMTEKG